MPLEGLIAIIVIAVVTSIINGAKKQKENQKRPPAITTAARYPDQEAEGTSSYGQTPSGSLSPQTPSVALRDDPEAFEVAKEALKERLRASQQQRDREVRESSSVFMPKNAVGSLYQEGNWQEGDHTDPDCDVHGRPELTDGIRSPRQPMPGKQQGERTGAQAYGAMFGSSNALRTAVVMSEILDRPVAVRGRRKVGAQR